MATARIIEAASAGLVWQRRLLLVKRGKEPSKGLFAFPGGRLEPGETPEAAARREIYEETRLVADALEHFETLDMPSSVVAGAIFRLHVFWGLHPGGKPDAADDAAEAGWFELAEIERMDMTDSSLRIARKLLDLKAGPLTQT